MARDRWAVTGLWFVALLLLAFVDRNACSSDAQSSASPAPRSASVSFPVEGSPVSRVSAPGEDAVSAASFEPPFRLVAIAPPSDKSGPVPVLRGKQPVAAVFSVPVIPLGASLFRGDASSDSHVPAFHIFTNSAAQTVKGRGGWVTTSVYRFDPEDAWPADLTVRVHLNRFLRSASGQRLAEDCDGAGTRGAGALDGRNEAENGADRKGQANEAHGRGEDPALSSTKSADGPSCIFRLRTETLRVSVASVTSDLASAVTDKQWKPILANSSDPLASLFEVPGDGRVTVKMNSPVALSALRKMSLSDRLLAVGREERNGEFSFVPFDVRACSENGAKDAFASRDSSEDSEEATRWSDDSGEDDQDNAGGNRQSDEVMCVELSFSERPLQTRAIYELFVKKGTNYSRFSGPLGSSSVSASPPASPARHFAFFRSVRVSPAFIDPALYAAVSGSRRAKGKGSFTGPRPFRLVGSQRPLNSVSYRRVALVLPHGLSGPVGEQAGVKTEEPRASSSRSPSRLASANSATDLHEQAEKLVRRMKLVHLATGHELSIRPVLEKKVHLILWCDELLPGETYKLSVVGNADAASENLFDGFGLPLESSEIEFSMSRLRPNLEFLRCQETVWVLNDRGAEATRDKGLPLALMTIAHDKREEGERRKITWGDIDAATLDAEPFGACVRSGDAKCVARMLPMWSHAAGPMTRHPAHELVSFDGASGAAAANSSPLLSTGAFATIVAPHLSGFSPHALYLVSAHTQHFGSTSVSSDRHLVGALSLSVFHSVHVEQATNSLVVSFQVLSLKTAQPLADATIRVFASYVGYGREPALLACAPNASDGEDASGARSNAGAQECTFVQTDAKGFAAWQSSEAIVEGAELFATVVAPLSDGSTRSKRESEELPAVFVTERLSWPWELHRNQLLGAGMARSGSHPSVLVGYDRRFFVSSNSLRFFVLADRTSFRPGDKVFLHGLVSLVNSSLCGFDGACFLHQALRLDAPEKLRVLIGAQWNLEAASHYEGREVRAAHGMEAGRMGSGLAHSCSVRVVALNHFGAFEASLDIPLDAELGTSTFLEFRIFKDGDVDEKALLAESVCPDTWYQLADANNLKRLDPAEGFSILVEDPRPPSLLVSPLDLPAVVNPASSFAVSGIVKTYGGLPVQGHRVEIRFAFQPTLGEQTLRKGVARLRRALGREAQVAGPASDFSTFRVSSKQDDVKVVTAGEVSSRDTVKLHAEVRTDAAGQFALPLFLEKLTVSPATSVPLDLEHAPTFPLLWGEGTEISVSVRVVGLTGDVLPPQTASVIVASSDFFLGEHLSLSVRPVLPGVPFAVSAVSKPYPGVKAGASLPRGSSLEVAVLRVDPANPLGRSWEAQADNWTSWHTDQGLAPCQPSLFSAARDWDAVRSADARESAQAHDGDQEELDAMEAFTDGSVDLWEFVEKQRSRFSVVKSCQGHGGRLTCPVTLPLDAAQYVFLTTFRLPDGRSVRNCEYFLPTAGNLLTRALKPDLRLDSPEVTPGQRVSLVLPAVFRPGSAIRPRLVAEAERGGRGGATPPLYGSLSVWWGTRSNTRLFFPVPLDSLKDELRIPIGRVPEDCPSSCLLRVVFVPPLSETPLPISQVDTSTNALLPRTERFPLETEAGAKFGPFVVDETFTVAVRAAASPFAIPDSTVSFSLDGKAPADGEASLRPGKKATLRLSLSTNAEQKAGLASLFSKLSSRKQVRAYALVALVDKRYFDLGPMGLPKIEEELRQTVMQQDARHSVSSSFAEATAPATYLYLFGFMKALKERDPWITDLHWPSAGALAGAKELTSPWQPWSKTLRSVLLRKRSTLTGSFSAFPRGENFVDGAVFADMTVEAAAAPMLGLAAAPRMAKATFAGRQAAVEQDAGAGVASSASPAVASTKLLLSDTPVILWKTVELTEDTRGDLTGHVSVRVPDDSNTYLFRSQVVVAVEEKEGTAVSFFRRLWNRRVPASPLSRVFYGQFEKEVSVKKRLKMTPFRPKLLRKGDVANVGVILQVDESLVAEGGEAIVYTWFPERGETMETGHRQRVQLTNTALPVTVRVDTDEQSVITNHKLLQVHCFAHLAVNSSVSHGLAFFVPVTPIAPRLSLSSIWAIVAPRTLGRARDPSEAADEAQNSVVAVEGVELPLPVMEGVGGLSASVGVGYGAVLLEKIRTFLSAEVCPFVPAKQAFDDLLWDTNSKGRETVTGSKAVFCTCCREAFPASPVPFFERTSPSLSSLLLAILARQLVTAMKLQVRGELEASAVFAETKLSEYVPPDAGVFRRTGFLSRPYAEYTALAIREHPLDVDLNLLVLLVAKRHASAAVLPYVASVKQTILAFLRESESRFLASFDAVPSPGEVWPQPAPLAASEPGQAVPDSSLAHASASVGHVAQSPQKPIDFSRFLAYVGRGLVARVRYVFGPAATFNLEHPEAEEALSFSSLLRGVLSVDGERGADEKEPTNELQVSPHLLWALVIGLENRDQASAPYLLALANAVLKKSVSLLRFLPNSGAYLSGFGSATAASDAQHAMLLQTASFVLSATPAGRSASAVLLSLEPEFSAFTSFAQLPPEDIIHIFSKVVLYLARGGKRGQLGPRRMVPWTGCLFRSPWEDLLVMDAFSSWHAATQSDRADLAVSVHLGTGEREAGPVGQRATPWLLLLHGHLNLRKHTAILETKLAWSELEASKLLGGKLSFVSCRARERREAAPPESHEGERTWEGKVRVNVKGQGVAVVAIGMDFIPDRPRMLPTFMGALLQKEFLVFDSATETCGNTPVASAVRGSRVCVALRITVKDEVRDVTIRDLLPAGLELSSRDPSMSPLAAVEDVSSSCTRPPHRGFLPGRGRGSGYSSFSSFWFFPRCEPRLLGNAVEWRCPFLAPGTHTLRVVAIATVSGFFAVPMATVEVGVDLGTDMLSRRQPGGKVTLLGASGAAKRAFVVLEEDERQLATNEAALFKEAGFAPPPAWLLGSAPKGCGVCPAGTVCSPALGKCVS
ncbi:conserved hypothetical protein [Neospora caninum Liverpool]|uniref:Bacterial alpha-2-macroglobulin MG10 domain-containing protein n=1 Tax=Neospora caninum (strain Liverpool) TaxID=572307 RepID=F0VPF1_NEOCL|nr:conserved hypothetical protein [Neospora caninum Liverpool]CBZ55597.1 conserved hypothetical protein [Neospora caninum Liverpool]CEL70339.1 TPA: hypothetical protein BN1204_060220 [Neospora caninum Liverpool]|eukprot:XP_003885625.1 conserved hypothetical protein [Neospora caninum Liverpool]